MSHSDGTGMFPPLQPSATMKRLGSTFLIAATRTRTTRSYCSIVPSWLDGSLMRLKNSSSRGMSLYRRASIVQCMTADLRQSGSV